MGKESKHYVTIFMVYSSFHESCLDFVFQHTVARIFFSADLFHLTHQRCKIENLKNVKVIFFQSLSSARK